MDWSTFSISNAAGLIKSRGDRWEQAIRSPITTHIVVGSFCRDERPGNSGETYWFDQETETSYNSMGLPSPAASVETQSLLKSMREEANAAGKRLIASISGFSPEENEDLAGRFYPFVDGIEWNASCPNAWGGTGKKAIASQEPELFKEVLGWLKPVGRSCFFRVKVSPLGDGLVHDIAKAIVDAGFVRQVVATNTYPNQVPKKPDGTDRLAFTVPGIDGIQNAGGMAGRGLKPHSLATVRALRKALPTHIEVIGCGGIFSGRDVVDYYEAGASGVQIGTAFIERTGKIFSDVMGEAGDLVG